MLRRIVRGVVPVTVLLVGCGSGGPAGEDPPGGGATTLEFTLNDAGCDPSTAEIAAGPVNFEIHGNSSQVTELEVLDGTTILGEGENVVAGLTTTFSLRLEAGTYTLYCPGGTQTERGTLTVTGRGGTALAAEERAAVNRYLSFVQGQADQLVDRTTQFTGAVIAGNVGRAKDLFAWSRAPYERIEPIAESFGDLDPLIDAREGDVPAAEWTGFHRLEKALWIDGSTDGMAPVARQLRADVERLQSLIPTVEVDVVQIANGASELLNEVSASKITGEEDRYSHTDLVDFLANLEGSEAAFRAIAPLLDDSDPALASDIDQRFADARDALSDYGEGTDFVPYTDLTPADTQRLSAVIDVLAEPLSRVASAIVGG